MNKTEQSFLEYLKYERNYSDNTITSYKFDLDFFHSFLFREDRDYINLTIHDIRDFETERLNVGDSKRTLSRRISSLRHYYKFMVRKKIIKDNPFLLIDSLKKNIKYPVALYASQINELLKRNARREDKIACRDQAILELLYSSGMRCNEVVNLKTIDIDFPSKVIRVFGKGKKERIVPFSGEAKKSMIYYAKDLREELLEN